MFCVDLELSDGRSVSLMVPASTTSWGGLLQDLRSQGEDPVRTEVTLSSVSIVPSSGNTLLNVPLDRLLEPGIFIIGISGELVRARVSRVSPR